MRGEWEDGENPLVWDGGCLGHCRIHAVEFIVERRDSNTRTWFVILLAIVTLAALPSSVRDSRTLVYVACALGLHG